MRKGMLIIGWAAAWLLAACGSGGGTAPEISDGAGTDPVVSADGDAASDMESEAADSERDDAWPACDTTAVSQTLSFVHVNDLHASYGFDWNDADAVSPWAHLRGFYNAVKAENPYTLFTNGGDDHEKGSVVEPMSSGYATVDASRLMGFDVRVIGNHDFAYSLSEFLAYTRDPHAVVLASNTHANGSLKQDFGAVDSSILTVGCVRIGFFGLTSEPWNEKDETYEGEFYPGTELHTTYDYTARANELIAALRPQVDVLVLVSHLGESGDVALAQATQGIDIILGGHSHTRIDPPEIVNGTRIIQAGSDGLYVARLDVDVDLTTRKITAHRYELDMNLLDNLPADMSFQKALATILRSYAPDAYDAVGRLRGPLADQTLANFTVKAVATQTKADAVLLDNGTIWAGLSRGPVTRQQFLNAFRVEREPSGTPGFNSFYSVSISGTELADLAAVFPKDGWTFLAPDTITPEATYKLAVQKRVALHPTDYLSVTLATPQEEAEVWRLLADYAAARKAQGLYADSDDALP